MKTWIHLAAALAGAGYVLAFPLRSFAATSTVMVGPGGNRVFTPSRITNHVGDSIQFVPTGSSHSVSPSGTSQPFCGNGNISSPCTVTFNTAGTFGFRCIPHFSSGMTGVVFVLSTANMPPTVAITNPPNGRIFVTPTNITIQASASDSDGSVTQVQFFAGGTLLGLDTAAPFSTVASNLTPGAFALTARATDNSGLRATSGVVNVTINDPPTVAMANPTNGTVLAGSLPTTLRATAADSDGSVTQVQFFANASLLGTSTNGAPPYSLTISNIASGSYALTAKASDNRGALTVSPAINVSAVTPGPIIFGTNLVMTNGQLPLTLSLTPGLRYGIETSSVFANWSNVVTFTAISNSYRYSNSIPPGQPRRFHRAHLLPNP